MQADPHVGVGDRTVVVVLADQPDRLGDALGRDLLTADVGANSTTESSGGPLGPVAVADTAPLRRGGIILPCLLMRVKRIEERMASLSRPSRHALRAT